MVSVASGFATATDDDGDDESGTETLVGGLLEPEFESEGANRDVTDEIELDDGPTIAEVTFGENGVAFDVTAVPQTDQDSDVPMMVGHQASPSIGGMMTSADSYVFEVDPVVSDADESDLEWELAITQPVAEEGEIEEPALEFEGDESSVLEPIRFDGTETVVATHDGEQFAAVALAQTLEQQAHAERFFVETEGPFEDESDVEVEGPAWVWIYASGEWALAVE